MSISIVVDLGYGDGGKGIVTDYLALSRPSKEGLVIRYNGGHQAGHTVYQDDGKKHVFSNYGSGTFRRYATYWSKYCTVNPVTLFNESMLLTQYNPKLYIDGLCPVTTPYDVIYNQALENSRNARHGSVGVGFGATVDRHENSPCKLFAQDLQNEFVLEQKLKGIYNYYKEKVKFDISIIDKSINLDKRLKEFKSVCKFVVAHLTTEHKIMNQYRYGEMIFEGAQGVLLDMDHGFFPHVTRSHTTSRNALEIIKRNKLEESQRFDDLKIYYVTRAYQTRHGHGPMTNELFGDDRNVINNAGETNKTDPYQGEFRKGYMDLEMLKYAISCDDNYSSGIKKNLVITCLDHLPNQMCIAYTEQIDCQEILSPEQVRDEILPEGRLLTSNSPYAKKIFDHGEKPDEAI